MSNMFDELCVSSKIVICGKKMHPLGESTVWRWFWNLVQLGYLVIYSILTLLWEGRRQIEHNFTSNFGSGFSSFTQDCGRYLVPYKASRGNLGELVGNMKKASYPLEILKVDVIAVLQSTLSVSFGRELI